MDNRFKFRVWSDKQKKMYYWSDIIKLTNFGYALFVDNRALGEGVWYKQQSTGLKDKNGKLIYEGDIVEVINCRGANAIVEYNTERAKFKLNGKKFSPSALEHIRNDYFEVIGNIYENVDLLEVKNNDK